MKIKKIAPKILWMLSVLTLIFLWAPVILIMVYSFSNNKYGSSWEGFTTKWYVKLITNDQVRDALFRSLIIAGVTTISLTLPGLLYIRGLPLGWSLALLGGFIAVALLGYVLRGGKV